MAAGASSIRILAESAVLIGSLEIPVSARGLIVLANAGANDSYATQRGLVAAELLRRGYGTLAVNLLTRDEEVRESRSGSHHLDVPFLTQRLCLVLGALRCDPGCRRHPIGIIAEGMAAAAAIGAAKHHKEVSAIVSWNGRADLAGDALTAVSAPILLLATGAEPHVLDLNRKAEASLRTISTLQILDVPASGAARDRVVAGRAADWFDAFVARDRTAAADECSDAHANIPQPEAPVIALRKILVATDFSEPAQVALQYGVDLAKRFEAQLHVLHVVEDLAAHPYAALPGGWDLGTMQTELEDHARAHLKEMVQEPDRSAVRAELATVVSASAADGILNYARDQQIDLIIIGTHGRRGLQRVFLGSVARHVSGVAECPVLTVRAHERDFVQPALPTVTQARA